MKPNSGAKWKRNKKNPKVSGPLQKFMVSVNDYVESHGGCGDAETDQRFRFVKKKSRKEKRKEKRRIKKDKLKFKLIGNVPVSTVSEQRQMSQGNKTKKVTKKVPDQKVPEMKKKGPLSTNKVRDPAKDEKTKIPSDSENPAIKKRKRNAFQETRKKALFEANAAEDREIKKLERLLGFNKRKNKQSLPQSFAAEGLDYILGILEPGSSAAGMHDSDEDEIGIDRAKDRFETLDDSEDEMTEEERGDASDGEDVSEEDGTDAEDEIDSGEAAKEQNEESEEEELGEDEADVFEKDEDEHEVPDEENEHVTGKYIPPHLREAVDSRRKAELERLKRNVKGLVNRLSEPNMASISGQLEALYMSCSRKDMNDTLTEVLLAACVTPVGANFLETVVHKFDELYQHPTEGKECDNLVAIVAHLYNFHVVHSLLIFDILKKLVHTFSEKDIELVLFLLKNVGFALRKDDALALKELISEAQKKASGVGSQFQNQTRVRFMLETMMALKNNDMRKIPGYDPEPVEKLRKLQRTLINKRASGTDVKLRVSLTNLLEAEQVGRWWIVGSSWTGAPMIAGAGNKTVQPPAAGGQFSTKVLDLARRQRMNTDIRKNIFCVIMTSEDYLDAFEKLLRLGLKDQQEREIVHVLLDCCLQEKTFNAFYAVLAEKFCSHDRRFQMTFQFSLWDKFKELSNLSSTTFTNLVQLVTRLLQKKSLSLSILKAIEFGELDKPRVKFLRQVLTKLLKESEAEDLVNIFGRISGIPKLGMLQEGLKLFISHFLLKNTQSLGTAEQAKLLTERAEVATKAMGARDTKLKL
uniref:MI domain-containing protein n=1 Tax=Denticeps clupeoides TaxID=299321 RepID=A0AAY4CCS9_9TELE